MITQIEGIISFTLVINIPKILNICGLFIYRTQITQIEGIVSLTLGIKICDNKGNLWENEISKHSLLVVNGECIFSRKTIKKREDL